MILISGKGNLTDLISTPLKGEIVAFFIEESFIQLILNVENVDQILPNGFTASLIDVIPKPTQIPLSLNSAISRYVSIHCLSASNSFTFEQIQLVLRSVCTVLDEHATFVQSVRTLTRNNGRVIVFDTATVYPNDPFPDDDADDVMNKSSEHFISCPLIPSLRQCIAKLNISAHVNVVPSITLPRLIVFDMDSTLVNDETLDSMAEHAFGAQNTANIAQLTMAAMQGQLTFGQSFRTRVQRFQGLLAREHLSLARKRLIFHKGAHRLIAALRTLGTHCIVVSGGLRPVARRLQRTLGLNDALANRMQVNEQGQWTGQVEAPLIDAIAKRRYLLSRAVSLGAQRKDVVAMGDGANDIPMMLAAGLGIAWMGKSFVKSNIPVHCDTAYLLDILYLFGWHQSQIETLLSEAFEQGFAVEESDNEL